MIFDQALEAIFTLCASATGFLAVLTIAVGGIWFDTRPKQEEEEAVVELSGDTLAARYASVGRSFPFLLRMCAVALSATTTASVVMLLSKF